jgi:hypothetical protein
MFEHLGMDFDKLIGADTGKTAGKTITLGTGNVAAASDDHVVTLYGSADEDLMKIRTIEREGDDLVVRGQAYGSIPLTAKLRPEQARRMLKLLSFSLVPFLFTFLFRRSKTKSAPR